MTTNMNNQAANIFCVAELRVSITLANTRYGMDMIKSFEPFRVNGKTDDDADMLFSLTVDDSLPPVKRDKERIRRFDTGNGDTIVDLLPDGGYQFIIKDIMGSDCCLLQANKDFSDCRCALNGSYQARCFGLNNAIMMVYAFAGSRLDTLLIHASLVRNNGYGYAFIAKSGTGKSTHVSMWLRHIEGCDLMNDDNPIVRVIDGQCFIYGSPWSGKTPCYRNVKARLGAITRIDRATQNSVERLSPIQAFASILPSCSNMKWDKSIFNNICNCITKIIELSDIYTLHCLPNKEAAQICHKAISK